MRSRGLCLAVVCGALLSAGVGVGAGADDAAKKKRAPTIADLEGRKVEVRTDEPVAGSAERARRNYEEFLSLGQGDAALRADAMRRLGDLKLEAGELDRIEKELAEGSPLDTTDAITLYSRLLAAYPDYPRNDAVLYQLARAYEADQQGERALATLDRLVARYPLGHYLDEAHFRRGEILFIAKRWADAEAAYAAVIAIGSRSEFYEQSLYKHGWSLFKRGESEAALNSFAKLLDRKLLDARGREVDIETFTRPQRELVEDTLRVCAITFSFDEGAKGVDSFLQHYGAKPYAHLLYGTLGDLYVSKERWTDAADAYRAFATHDPDDERAPLLQMQAIEAYRRGGFASLVLDGKREYVERYRLGSSFWAHRQKSDAPLVVAELKTNIHDLATYHHARAQATKQPVEYQEAAHWYREYLQSFPDDKEAAATDYLLADALFESHQFHDAALEYERVAYGYPPNDKSATAGYAALVAFEKHEAELPAAERGEWHVRGLESGLRFATAFQDHPESAPVLARTAREYYDVKEYAKAIDVADMLLARRPPIDVDKQRQAWTVIANGQFELGQFDKAEGAYLQVQTLLAPDDKQRPAIDERIAASVYKQGEGRKAAGDDAGAVKDFLRVQELAPGSKIRATADYDAAALLIGLKDWPKAIEVLEGFRRNFPKSELQSEVTRKLAAAYVEAGRTGAAAVEFERMASAADSSPAVQREALAQAAALYEQAGDVPRTTASLENYVRRFPQPFAPALEARQKLADFAAARGDAARRAGLLADVIKADQSAAGERTDRSRYLAAKASLELALPTRDAFNAVRLMLPLKKSLEAKRGALQNALKAFEAADSYAIAEVSTAATFDMAELYRQLAQDLIKSERPRKLAGEELEQYDLLLEEQAFPFEEKAIEIHLVNAMRAQHGIYDDGVRASYAALAKLKPARFGKLEEHEGLQIDAAAGRVAPPLPTGVPPGTVAAPPGPVVPLALSVRFQEAVAAADHGEAPKAESELQALEALLPTLAGPPLNRGIVLARAGRWNDAEAALTEAARRYPDSPIIADELGVVSRQLGKFAAAEAAYRRSLELDANVGRTHRNLGVLLDLYLQNPAEALVHYQTALTLTGEDKQMAAWIAELKQRLGAGQKSAQAEVR